MKQCPNGHSVGDNVKFCPECGAEIKDNGAKFCAKCGNELKGTEKFCPQCGTPYGHSSINMMKNNSKSNSSVKKGILIAIIVGAIGLFVLALGGGAAWYFLYYQNRYSLEGLAKAAVNYDAVGDFHDGLAMVHKGDKYGFIDKLGNEVIPCIYDFLPGRLNYNFHDGLAFVMQGEKHFFINKEGKEAFPYNYDYATYFSDGLAVVGKGDKYGYIDTNGKEVISLTDKYIGESFSDGLAAVWNDDGKYGFIDKKGDLLIPYTFEDHDGINGAGYFNEGLAIVYKNDKPSCIDKNGNELSIGNYLFILNFHDGMAAVNRDNKYGFIDTSGKEVIPCAYEEASSFSEGYAFVKKDGKYMQIDKSGKILNTFNYEYISDFHDGLARVSNKSGNETLSGYIDVYGKEIIPCIYNSCSDFSEGLAVVEKDGIYGFVDKKGNSTFDIQDEEVKRVVQAKIDEKERIRKEEERKRIEEENSPTNRFYKIAQSGNCVWRYSISEIKKNYSWNVKTNIKYDREDRTICTFFFYPESTSTGRLSYVEYEEIYYGEVLETSYINTKYVASYVITDNILNATLNHVKGNVEPFVRLSGSIGLRIEKDGETIKLITMDGNYHHTYYQETKTHRDPQF